MDTKTEKTQMTVDDVKKITHRATQHLREFFQEWDLAVDAVHKLNCSGHRCWDDRILDSAISAPNRILTGSKGGLCSVLGELEGHGLIEEGLTLDLMEFAEKSRKG